MSKALPLDNTINQRYILHETLGKGGMGIVYRATDRLNREPVALKQVYLPPEQLQFMSRSASMTTQMLRVAWVSPRVPDARLLAPSAHHQRARLWLWAGSAALFCDDAAGCPTNNS